MNKRIVYIIIVFSSIVFSMPVLMAGQSEERYKLAESFEKGGDLKNASRLYLELWNSDKSNDKYFDAVVRTYKAQNLWMDLLPVVSDELELKKTSVTYSLYGEILWKQGRTADANKAWDDAIETAPRSYASYIDVANSQIACYAYDKAIAILEKGRSKLNIKNLFANELSQLYTMTGNYKQATYEILSLFEQTRNIGIAQGKISALMSNPQAIDYINKILADKASSSEIPEVKRLYVWFLRSIKKFDAALKLCQEVDNDYNTRGMEVLNFANSCQSDGQYDIAIKAYEYVIDKGKSSPYIMNALFGFARTLEYKIADNDKIPKETVLGIIERYKSIIKEFPNNPIADECRMRSASLYNNLLNDKPSAIQILTELTERNTFKPITASALNLLGDIYLQTDKLDLARENYESIVQRYKNLSPIDYNLAEYKIAELEYFEDNIDTAETLFGKLCIETNSDIANEALEKIVIIENNKSLTAALKSFANAELLEKQKKPDEAIKKYDEVIALADASDIGERAYIKKAKILYSLGKYSEARSALDSLVSGNPKTIYADLAKLIVGNCFLAEKNDGQANKVFTEFLAEFPRSIYLDEVRDKLRALRKTNL